MLLSSLYLFLPSPSHIYRGSSLDALHLVGRRVAPGTDLGKVVGSFLPRVKVGGCGAHSTDHGGRPTGEWAQPPPAFSGGLPCVFLTLFHVPEFSGGLPCVFLSLFHVPEVLVCRFGAACGPFDPCEPEFCALIGRRFFPWIIRPS